MYAEVHLRMDHRANAIAIPVTAVDADPESANHAKAGKVLVVTTSNRIEPRRVTLGMETENAIEVKSGLREGEFVVIGSRTSLQAGQEVTPKPVSMAVLKEGH
jgi:multidrug efflux pump subunit AcrA (membrane-fusion protein)